MNILSELEGLSGENLCSSALRLLLIRSQDLRDRFINLLSRECRSGPITLSSYFSCTLEERTEESDRWGRLDLLLEMSNAVVGIENKLNAPFQDGQPHKYHATVEQRAKDLETVRGRNFLSVVAVLAPEGRSKEVAKLIGNNEGLLSLDWEKVLIDFNDAADSLDPETKVLMRSLVSYVHQQISLFPEWERWTPHLHRKFSRGGTQLQREVVTKLWQFFPDAGSRRSAGDTWCGYYFTDPSLKVRGWFGFVPKVALKSAKNEVEFIIATSFEVRFPESIFRKVELKIGPRFIQADQIHCYTIELDNSWAQPSSWRQRLQPLSATYEEIQSSATTSGG